MSKETLLFFVFLKTCLRWIKITWLIFNCNYVFGLSLDTFEKFISFKKPRNVPLERISSYCDPRNWQCPFRSIGILNYFSKLVFELESFVSLLELKQIQILGLLQKLLTLRPKYFCSHNLFLIASRLITTSWWNSLSLRPAGFLLWSFRDSQGSAGCLKIFKFRKSLLI